MSRQCVMIVKGQVYSDDPRDPHAATVALSVLADHVLMVVNLAVDSLGLQKEWKPLFDEINENPAKYKIAIHRANSPLIRKVASFFSTSESLLYGVVSNTNIGEWHQVERKVQAIQTLFWYRKNVELLIEKLCAIHRCGKLPKKMRRIHTKHHFEFSAEKFIRGPLIRLHSGKSGREHAWDILKNAGYTFNSVTKEAILDFLYHNREPKAKTLWLTISSEEEADDRNDSTSVAQSEFQTDLASDFARVPSIIGTHSNSREDVELNTSNHARGALVAISKVADEFHLAEVWLKLLESDAHKQHAILGKTLARKELQSKTATLFGCDYSEMDGVFASSDPMKIFKLLRQAVYTRKKAAILAEQICKAFNLSFIAELFLNIRNAAQLLLTSHLVRLADPIRREATWDLLEKKGFVFDSDTRNSILEVLLDGGSPQALEQEQPIFMDIKMLDAEKVRRWLGRLAPSKQ